MPSFAIIRTKKHKHIASIVGVARHHAREVPCPTADPERASKNMAWGAGKSASQAVGNRVTNIIEEAQKKAGKKFRSDSVKAVEYLMTASHEWWQDASQKQKNGYLKKCRSWLENKHGVGCVVAEWLHVDERSPHLHAIVVPLQNGVLNAKHFLGGRERLRALQDDFAEVCGKPYGLTRGVRGSNAEHVPVADWWAALNAPVAQPKKLDFAKAAVGVDVPVIELASKQARAFDVQRTTATKLRKRAVLVEETAEGLAARSSHIAQREAAQNAKTERLITLEKENMALRGQLAALAPAAPGQTLANLGL